MTRFEVQRILKKEGLKYYNLFSEHEVKPREQIVQKRINKGLSGDEHTGSKTH